jgi:glyoxylase-like metal-dependent hydrolase (beta-lactamase superfamily II)
LIEVAPGVHWLRMPIPLALDHINLWLIEDEDDAGAPTWTIVDSGYGHQDTKDLWAQIFNGPAAHRRPHRLICTHYHPDHFGLAGWLVRTYGVDLSMTETEWVIGVLLQRLDDKSFVAGQEGFFTRHGMATDMRARLAQEGNEYAGRVDLPPDSFRRIRDGDCLQLGGRDWHIIVVEGHAPEQALLYCPEIDTLICGDQLLPKITPNISVYWFKAGTRPLGDFLASLTKLEGLVPAQTLVLPSHKLPYYGVATRIAQLHAHHAERLLALLSGMDRQEPRSAAALVPSLFPRKLDDLHMIFALGETIAHLEHLVGDGRAEMTADADGVHRYRLTDE